jgi:hypothetical protein
MPLFCQTENREGAGFCDKCGKPLQQDIVCPECNHNNPLDHKFCDKCGHVLVEEIHAHAPTKPSPQPTSFAGGRYQVKKFLGEGGKKKVYLAHDSTLDRDVAFALIKTEKLDETGKTRIKREVQAMGKLGDHPNIVTVYDFGDHEGQPYIVLPLLSGGDVEGLIKKAPTISFPSTRRWKSLCRFAKDLSSLTPRASSTETSSPATCGLALTVRPR